MQLRLLEKQKDSVRIEILNPDDTVIYPLITALLKDPEVEDALYYTGHPQLDKPVLTVKVKKGSPQAALKRVAEVLATEFGGAKQLLEKEFAYGHGARRRNRRLPHVDARRWRQDQSGPGGLRRRGDLGSALDVRGRAVHDRADPGPELGDEPAGPRVGPSPSHQPKPRRVRGHQGQACGHHAPLLLRERPSGGGPRTALEGCRRPRRLPVRSTLGARRPCRKPVSDRREGPSRRAGDRHQDRRRDRAGPSDGGRVPELLRHPALRIRPADHPCRRPPHRPWSVPGGGRDLRREPARGGRPRVVRSPFRAPGHGGCPHRLARLPEVLRIREGDSESLGGRTGGLRRSPSIAPVQPADGVRPWISVVPVQPDSQRTDAARHSGP